MTDEEFDRLEEETIQNVEECMRFMDSSTQTFVFVMMDYENGELRTFSNAHSAEEAYFLLLEGASLAKEDCLEENKADWPIDIRFN
jgi:hypothetical protein